MPKNRTVPVDTLIPHLPYRDLEAAIAWLGKAFGFKEHFRYGDPISGAQLQLGDVYIMVSTERPPQRQSPASLGGTTTQSLTIFVDNVDEHYARSKSVGATIVEEPHETVYGEYQYAAYDLDSHHWIFSRHARDLSPEDWGATLAKQ
ncbi:MAG TPA: VOC family protein [Alloacidobacterium sp.]|nr:VOC family protein [Alloacidobacterium sp.]